MTFDLLKKISGCTDENYQTSFISTHLQVNHSLLKINQNYFESLDRSVF